MYCLSAINCNDRAILLETEKSEIVYVLLVAVALFYEMRGAYHAGAPLFILP